MAIYHCTAKTGSKQKGQSARAKAQYILREGRYHRSKKEVLFSMSCNMPSWAFDQPLKYWSAADDHERTNGRLYKEIEFALPRELTVEQQIKLAREFAQQLTTKENLPYTLAIHSGKGKNPHCHLMISERMNDGLSRAPENWFKRVATGKTPPEQGGAKKTETLKPTEWLEQTREAWGDHANRALEKAGSEARIDHRSLEVQGLARLPQIHMGSASVEMEERGILTDRAERALEISEANRQIEELRKIENEIEIHAHERTRPRDPSPLPAAGSRRVAPAAPGNKPENHPNADPDRQHGPSLEKTPAAAPAASKKQQPTRPASGPVTSPPPQAQGGPEDMMNLSAEEQQEFLRVRRLMARQQEEERHRQQLSEEQKQRVEELIQRAEEAARKRPDHIYWEDYFAMDCLEELRQRKQAVEQANWKEIESKVVRGLLADGATVKDAAELLHEVGVSPAASSEKKTDPVVTPPDGPTTQERLALEYLKTLAASNPDLANAVEQAEKRQKDEALDAQREQMQQAQTSTPQPK